MIKGSEICHISVPHYETLALKDIKTFIVNYPDIWNYLPAEIELTKLPRQYICNIIATREFFNFSSWIRNRVETRNESVKSKKNMNIEMDPELAEIFSASTKVSCKYYTIFNHLIISYYCSIQGHWGKYAQSREQEKKDPDRNRGAKA